MTQNARPRADVSNNGWTIVGASSIWAALQDTILNPASYAQANNAAGMFEVRLSSAVDPLSSAGHVLHLWSMAVGGGGPERLTVELYQGAALIATCLSNQAISRAGFTEYTYALLTTEADVISDYHDLRVRCTVAALGGGELLRVAQIYLELPDEVPTVVLPVATGRGF